MRLDENFSYVNTEGRVVPDDNEYTGRITWTQLRFALGRIVPIQYFTFMRHQIDRVSSKTRSGFAPSHPRKMRFGARPS
jgi:hypothetical protein